MNFPLSSEYFTLRPKILDTQKKSPAFKSVCNLQSIPFHFILGSNFSDPQNQDESLQSSYYPIHPCYEVLLRSVFQSKKLYLYCPRDSVHYPHHRMQDSVHGLKSNTASNAIIVSVIPIPASLLFYTKIYLSCFYPSNYAYSVHIAWVSAPRLPCKPSVYHNSVTGPLPH